ncbi:unnamed protein product [Aspergillus oryzae]|uniref:Unnamed protein product n=1 Tax=Aspergillus oryzae var. brunneus TaxID=332754 RepID=A0ABQ6L6K2_ASPOZ|nr:unnamed protein product [Aspergillus oryzae]GMF88349.1 unnamed protein product [Aspergillus oryzae]GMG00876.1 unnamed protein product [Aspergillus oryzae]GMG53656.1 unnamed protein product [Aspergillus oryzae var. brunneus]
MASAVLGAAFRLATALGLHKEPLEGKNTRDDLQNHLTSAETRRPCGGGAVPAARRSYDVVESIYDASKDVTGLEESREILTAFGEMDMEFWDLAKRGFESDYEWESLIDWEKALIPNVGD